MCLVTDVGLRYPLADADTIQRLGYAGVAPVRLPARLVALLPAGPVLDSAAAGRPTGGTG
jgi:hypothetical protein